MHPETRQVATHMREFGMSILGRAVYDLTFSEMMAPYKHSMAVGIAAHGSEIVIKARIAEEHPLLLFTQLPKSANADDKLTIKEALRVWGRTIQYSDLPEALWAATGIRMERVEQYQRFGKHRNQMIHFGVPDAADVGCTPMKFLFEVMEPLVRQFWDASIIPYAAEWDEYVYQPDGLADAARAVRHRDHAGDPGEAECRYHVISIAPSRLTLWLRSMAGI